MTTEAIAPSTPERLQSPHILGVRNLQENPLSAEELLQSQELYARVVQERAEGPQREGLQPFEVISALVDTKTVALDIETPEGVVSWPIFTPVVRNKEYRAEFFSDHFGQDAIDRSFFYSPLPEQFLENANEAILPPQVADELVPFVTQEPIIAFDYQEGVDGYTPNSFAQITAEIGARDEDVTPDDPRYGRPGVVYNETLLVPRVHQAEPKSIRQVFEEGLRSGKFERRPENGATLLMPEDFRADDNALLNRIWQIYEEQFDILVEDDPSRQKQSREELEEMILNEKNTVVGCFKDDEIIGLCFFVSDYKECPWQNQQYYQERYGNHPVAIYPGIVIDVNKIGEHHADMMTDMLAEVLGDKGEDVLLLFQCTKISQTYVPFKVVYPGIVRSNKVDAEPFTQNASYANEAHKLSLV